MLSKKPVAIRLLAVPALASGLWGCAPTGDALLDQTLGEVLNQVTVGDLVAGFQEFAGQFEGGEFASARGPALSDEQRAVLEALQQQLDAGEITREEFHEQIRELIGDRAPNQAFAGFGFFGGPFGFGSQGEMADPLGLMEEQRAAAREIFEQLHADIRALRDDTHLQIEDVLTEEQRAILEEMRSRRFGFPQLRMGAPDDMPAIGQTARRSGGPGGGFGGRFGDERPFADRLAEELGLTEEQQSAIDAIREELRTAVRARHDQAREEFRALLTEDQVAILDEIEAEREARHSDDKG